VIQTSGAHTTDLQGNINVLENLMRDIQYGDGTKRGTREKDERGEQLTNRQKFLTLSSLVEGLKYKVTGSKMSTTSDDSLVARGEG